jgi:hypothetical protein
MSATLVDKYITVKEFNSDVDSGIELQNGDWLDISVSGSICAGVWFTGENGPNGWAGWARARRGSSASTTTGQETGPGLSRCGSKSGADGPRVWRRVRPPGVRPWLYARRFRQALAVAERSASGQTPMGRCSGHDRPSPIP